MMYVLQANRVHAFGDSITFGRFTSESLGCEKWSSAPQKRYVEEAKSYTQPGSVAEKKAFFEAYYKRIAAQKAAAEALLEQEKAAAAAARQVCDTVHDSETTKARSHDSLEAVLKSNSFLAIDTNIVAANTKKSESKNNNENLEDHVSVSVSAGSRTSQMERPLLKSKSKTDEEVTQPMIKRKPAISSLVSSVGRKTSRIPPSPSKSVASVQHMKDNISTPRTKNCITNDYADKRRTTAKSLKMLMSSSFVKEPCITAQSTKPPSSVLTTPKRGATPAKTPDKAFTNGVNKQPLATPSSANRRRETPVHPTAGESKSTGPKWHVLSAVSKSLSGYKKKLQSPTIPSPFLFRTEDRAARRKQKLEEKFNEKEAQKLQQQTHSKEKADTEIGRLRQTFCFKARPLPDFYKGRETPKNQMKTPDEANPKLFTPQRKAPSSNTSLAKRKSSRSLWKNNDQNPAQHPFSSAAGMMSHENTSPNIQHLASKHTHSKRPT